MKRLLGRINRFLSKFFINPLAVYRNWKAIPIFISNMVKYQELNKNDKFKLSLANLYFTSADRYETSGTINTHYFHQDLWAARKIFAAQPFIHFDIGSRLDGFVSHVLSFCDVNYVDIRPLESKVQGLHFIKGSITDLPFKDDSIESLSCLHVLEHIGLGRYGDTVDPGGYLTAAKEMIRVLKPGGKLYFSTPIGIEALYFDAHRVFSPKTILDLFAELEVEEFSFIDDHAKEVALRPEMDTVQKNRYGCGLFVFSKNG